MTKTSSPRPDPARSGRHTRHDYPRFRQITTRWMDNDVYGHVNNVIYYSFFDTAVNATLIDEGLLDPQTSPVIGLVVETGCSYAVSRQRGCRDPRRPYWQFERPM